MDREIDTTDHRYDPSRLDRKTIKFVELPPDGPLSLGPVDEELFNLAKTWSTTFERAQAEEESIRRQNFHGQ